jgi:hypothetical protein
MLAARWAFLACLTSVAPIAAAPPDEPVPIGEIVADPQAHHLKLVTLQGTVRQVQPREPYFQPEGPACYGAYTFVLEDDTGTLDVVVLGICGVPTLRTPEVAEGDIIVLKAKIQAPALTVYSRGPDGQPLRPDTPEKVQAVANAISRLTE